MLKRMAKQMDTVLLACGSFNPLTNWHLRMFELARDYFHKESHDHVIKGIISPVDDHYPTDKKKLAESRHRCEMIQRSLQAFDGVSSWISLDTWESQQGKWIRTRAVMDYHFNKLNSENKDGSKPEIRLKLLCGADMFETFNVPNLWSDEDIDRIVGKYGMVVITREPYNPWKTLCESPKSHILLKYKANIDIVVETCANTVSSTYIREAIRNGESVKYLLPDPTIKYIYENKLYQ